MLGYNCLLLHYGEKVRFSSKTSAWHAKCPGFNPWCLQLKSSGRRWCKRRLLETLESSCHVIFHVFGPEISRCTSLGTSSRLYIASDFCVQKRKKKNVANYIWKSHRFFWSYRIKRKQKSEGGEGGNCTEESVEGRKLNYYLQKKGARWSINELIMCHCALIISLRCLKQAH